MKTSTSNFRPGSPRAVVGQLTSGGTISVVMMLLVGTVSAHSQFEYTNYDDEITITRYTGPGGDVVIPQKIHGSRVTSIGDLAFFNCTNVTGVTVREGVIRIGNSAFEGCLSLTSFALPGTLTSLGARAFFDCTSLTNVSLPGSITYWPEIARDSYPEPISGSWVFADCTNLMTVTIGDGLQSIPPYGFTKCVRLTGIVIPDSVRIIGRSAFEDCHGVTEVTIPTGVTNVGAYAFRRCASLTNLAIPGSITEWPEVTVPLDQPIVTYPLPSITGSWVFQDCTNVSTVTIGIGVSIVPAYGFSGCISLTTVLLPNTVSSIGEGAFEHCSSVSNVTLSDSVIRIGDSAFADCSGLTNVTVGKSLTNLWRGVFANCRNLTGITVDALNPAYSSMDGVLFNKNRTALIICPQGTTGTYTIPETVTTIGTSAFAGCVRLSSVTIPNTVSSIGDQAFASCSSLNGITIPNSVSRLGTYAFAGCTSLTNLTIPGSVKDWVTVTHPGYSNPPVIVPPYTDSGTFSGCTNLRTVTVEDGVTNIPAGAFAGCSRLTCITIPESVVSLGTAPVPSGGSWPIFLGCTNLTGIYFEGNSPNLLSGFNFFFTFNPMVYYLRGTTGWGATYGGCPTALWRPRIESSDASFGVRDNQFGFNIRWASGRHVVVETCSDLLTGVWTPLATNTLTRGSAYFSDAEWTNYPSRFYRVQCQ